MVELRIFFPELPATGMDSGWLGRLHCSLLVAGGRGALLPSVACDAGVLRASAGALSGGRAGDNGRGVALVGLPSSLAESLLARFAFPFAHGRPVGRIASGVPGRTAAG